MGNAKMEDLVKKMQEMFKRGQGTEESDKYLFFSPKYNSKVKVSEWFLPLEAEPKDNNPYSPPGGDYFLSTYKRLGTDDNSDLESETHAMLRQVCSVQPVHKIHKPLVHLETDLLLRMEVPTLPTVGKLFEDNDFTTTYEYDFREPFPYKQMSNRKREPKIKQKKQYGLVSMFNTSKICETKFLDDKFYNLPEHTKKGCS